MGRRSDPQWRDQAAADLAARCLQDLGPLGDALEGEGLPGAPDSGDAAEAAGAGSLLLVDDPLGTVADAAASRGHGVERWNRSDATTPGLPGTPWPGSGAQGPDTAGGKPYDLAMIRLPRAKEALSFALQAAATVTRPGGWLAVYGAKDEGIASTPRILSEHLDDVTTLATGGRCRVVAGRRRGASSPETSLEDWRRTDTVELGWGPLPWVSFPGTFARGGLDAGTALLAGNLPEVGPESSVLDFAAGTGLLAACVSHAAPGAQLALVEPDALARRAALENVPGARDLALAGWTEGGPFDLIVSNPPYHVGKAEDLSVVTGLVQGALEALAPGGELRMVVQRRLPVEAGLQEAFQRVDVVADQGPYRVWSAKKG